jgi:hypothetical protein
MKCTVKLSILYFGLIISFKHVDIFKNKKITGILKTLLFSKKAKRPNFGPSIFPTRDHRGLKFWSKGFLSKTIKSAKFHKNLRWSLPEGRLTSRGMTRA